MKLFPDVVVNEMDEEVMLDEAADISAKMLDLA